MYIFIYILITPQNTVADFWELVWVQKVPAIVMLTNLVEAGKFS